MTLSITLGWWLLPLAITILMPALTIWRTNRVATYDRFGIAVEALIVFGFWAFVSAVVILGSWLIWALL